ncbi:DUF1961 family protein [Domibacillus indicus]|uniref:DUF1961 family protein n=1 Tax=Domibacillus indicus TaxID=1437523 RepID=UPI000617AB8E|nr:DUF1961 family protein [Domibacillus indicus]
MSSKLFEQGRCLYENSLQSEKQLAGWRMEGEAVISFEEKGLILENALDADEYGDDAHFVYWCPENFPDQIIIEWDFYPVREPGLCMVFFAATGRHGEDLFDPALPVRTGRYPEYHSGAVNALHLSYFRHKHAEERAFRTCNLRKSYGFHLAAQAADPLPPAEDALEAYRMKVIKYDAFIEFYINDFPVLSWTDDGQAAGPVFRGGKIGFRQMAPMKAAYSNLTIHEALLKNDERNGKR